MLSNGESIKKIIKAEAYHLGFALCGFTTPDPPPHLHVFQDWINNGYHAEMTYLARPDTLARRANPQRILPECKTILVVALPYTHPAELPANEQHPKVAAYAGREDYHDIIPALLEQLMQHTRKSIGIEFIYRIYTDTGPILERDLAQRAGLGWIGKNTCLIHPEIGSYFLLGEAFLSLHIDPDPPFSADRCGSCTRCIDACPTGCILPNRTIDARQCISYLTIENKQHIPSDVRPYLGDWIFGCDICQQVCPWNLHARPMPVLPGFRNQQNLQGKALAAYLLCTEQDFQNEFQRSPVSRTKRRGFVRNLLIYCGNHPDICPPEVLAALLFNDPQVILREAAAWALGKYQMESAKQILQQASEKETDPVVKVAIQAALHTYER